MSLKVTFSTRTHKPGTMDLNFLNIPDDTEIIDIIVGEKEITKLADFYNFYFMRTCFE